LNYLAHALLSFSDDAIQVGNLMGDFIKGNQYNAYPDKMAFGMQLHRRIDSFTDSHPQIQHAVRMFKPHFRLSGGILVDILFDHFLANDSRYFTDEKLLMFTTGVYQNLAHHTHYFNTSMRTLFDHMTTHNWLYHYKSRDGLMRAVKGMCTRYPMIGDGNQAITLIDQQYEPLLDIYTSFFTDLEQFVHSHTPGKPI
jgi:acyl carrier protein phosphodiesterase